MALNPSSEKPDLGAPPDYAADHPREHPEQWGWHGEWGRAARVGAWVVAAILLLMITSTRYNHQGTMWLLIFTGGLLAVLIWDARRRRNAWRK